MKNETRVRDTIVGVFLGAIALAYATAIIIAIADVAGLI